MCVIIKIESSDDMARANDEVIEKAFREVATEMTKYAILYRQVAKITLNEKDDESEYDDNMVYGSDEATRKTIAAVLLAFSVELAFKAQVIYYDLSKTVEYTQNENTNIGGRQRYKVGTPEWRSDIDKTSFLRDPSRLLQQIQQVSSSDDLRQLLYINADARTDAERNYNNQHVMTLHYDGNTKMLGHSLFANYQLLPAEIKTLLNLDLFSYTENYNLVIYALLFKTIFDNDIILEKPRENATDDRPLTLSKDIIINIDKIKHVFDIDRYFAITGETISDEDFQFLDAFSLSAIRISRFCFPPKEKIKAYQDTLEQSTVYSGKGCTNLKLSQQYFYSLLSDSEKRDLDRFLTEHYYMDTRKMVDPIDENIFVNVITYLKFRFTNGKPPINIPFTYDVYKKINERLYQPAKAFEPFGDNSKKLADFISISEELIEELKQDLANKSKIKTNLNISKEERVSFIQEINNALLIAMNLKNTNNFTILKPSEIRDDNTFIEYVKKSYNFLEDFIISKQIPSNHPFFVSLYKSFLETFGIQLKYPTKTEEYENMKFTLICNEIKTRIISLLENNSDIDREQVARLAALALTETKGQKDLENFVLSAKKLVVSTYTSPYTIEVINSHRYKQNAHKATEMISIINEYSKPSNYGIGPDNIVFYKKNDDCRNPEEHFNYSIKR